MKVPFLFWVLGLPMVMGLARHLAVPMAISGLLSYGVIVILVVRVIAKIVQRARGVEASTTEADGSMRLPEFLLFAAIFAAVGVRGVW